LSIAKEVVSWCVEELLLYLALSRSRLSSVETLLDLSMYQCSTRLSSSHVGVDGCKSRRHQRRMSWQTYVTSKQKVKREQTRHYTMTRTPTYNTKAKDRCILVGTVPYLKSRNPQPECRRDSTRTCALLQYHRTYSRGEYISLDTVHVA